MNKDSISIELKNIVKIASCVCVVAFITMIIALNSKQEITVGEFVAPSFETTVQEGFPVVDNSSYSEVYMDGMSFSAYVCALFEVEDNTADVYFTNPSTNTAWLRLRVLNSEGDIIAETGIVKPNEYIVSIEFTEEINTGDSIKLVLMAYEAETYLSLGSVSLNTTIN